MQAHTRHVVVDQDFERTLVDLYQALDEAGLEIVSRIDVRDHFERTLGREFRRHLVFDVWSPDLAVDAIRDDLEIGTFIMTRVVIYELADGETVVATTDGLSSFLADPQYKRAHPLLASLSHRERRRANRVLQRLERRRVTASVAA